MILRDTNIRGALRDKQRGFLMNPFRFGLPAAAVITLDPTRVPAGITLSGGNLIASKTSLAAFASVFSTEGRTTGKWYCEFRCDTSDPTANYVLVGLSPPGFSSTFPGSTLTSYGYYQQTGQKYNNNVATAYGTSWVVGDIIGLAFDGDNGEVYFSKNGIWQNSSNPVTRINPAFTGISGTHFATVSLYNGINPVKDSYTARFTAAALSYAVPTGFAAWSIANADPNYANVALLLNGGEAHNSATLIDGSSYNASPAIQGAGIVYKNDKVAVGTTSIYQPVSVSLRYSGTRFLIAANTEFTYELYLYYTTTSGGQIARFSDTEAAGRIVYYITADGNVGKARYGEAAQLMAAVNAVPINTWSHIVITRYLAGGSYYEKAAVNGVWYAALAADARALGNGSGGFLVEHSSTVATYKQMIRITLGVVRYAIGSNFTPPAALFPTS